MVSQSRVPSLPSWPPNLAMDKMTTSKLPISSAQTVRVAQWMIANFDTQLRASIAGTPLKRKHLCGIVCQETAYVWLGWTKKYDVSTILARCVFDASGDAAAAPRSAFPKNTAAFRAKYGDPFSQMLIDEANATRRMRGYPPKEWVYKGYGLFQYDLQKVTTDETFFSKKQWYSFDTCLGRAIQELIQKFNDTRDIWKAIERYNGSGPKAVQYRENVREFTEICGAVTGEA